MKHFQEFFVSLLLMALPLTGNAQGTVDIEFNGAEASVFVPDTVTDVIYNINGAKVAIVSNTTDKEYTYRVRGASDDGALTITGKYKLILELNGLTLTNNSSGAAIDVQCGKNIDVVLNEGTVNTLCDSYFGSQKAAFYFKGHPEFKGGGTLNVTGRLGHAISAKEEMQLKPSLGIINILGAVKDGLHCGRDVNDAEHNFFEMKGGTVNITNVSGDGIDCGDYGSLRILGGALSINVGNDATGLKADSIITVSDGSVNISVTGKDSEAIRARYAVNMEGGKTNIVVTGDGSKGIKGKRYTADDKGATVINGGFVNISGGTIDILATGGNLIDVALEDTTKCMAISVDADLMQTGGDVCLTANGPEAKTYNVKGTETHNGGTFILQRAPWKFNATDYRYDMTVYAILNPNLNPNPNLNDYAVGAFIDDVCVGIAQPVGNQLLLRVYSNSAESQPVTFRFYSYTEEQEYTLTPSEEVFFQDSAAPWLPDTPLTLSYEAATLKGDVNNDGRVNIADIILIQKAIAEGGIPSADANNDSLVNNDDILYVLMLLCQ